MDAGLEGANAPTGFWRTAHCSTALACGMAGHFGFASRAARRRLRRISSMERAGRMGAWFRGFAATSATTISNAVRTGAKAAAARRSDRQHPDPTAMSGASIARPSTRQDWRPRWFSPLRPSHCTLRRLPSIGRLLITARRDLVCNGGWKQAKKKAAPQRDGPMPRSKSACLNLRIRPR